MSEDFPELPRLSQEWVAADKAYREANEVSRRCYEILRLKTKAMTEYVETHLAQASPAAPVLAESPAEIVPTNVGAAMPSAVSEAQESTPSSANDVKLDSCGGGATK